MVGYVALILHAHLPFVRHPEHEHFLEEDWFFEAVTVSYIPLLRSDCSQFVSNKRLKQRVRSFCSDAMRMSSFSVKSLMVFGYPNAPTPPVWNRCCKKRMFAGSFSTHTACCLENRARAARFTPPVTHHRDRRHLRATRMQVGRSGARTKAIREIQLIGNFIATLVLIFPCNTWDQSRAEQENFPV